jgi:hypothetical protein
MSGEVSITLTKTLPDSSAKADFHELVSTATAAVQALAITNAEVSASAAIVDTKLATISTAGKVSGAALTGLSSVPSGAGSLPNVNMGIGEIIFKIDGGGFAISTGIKGDLRVPYAITITGAYLLADQTGSIVVDIWKCSYAQFDGSTHPVDGDSITSATPPTITSAVKSTDTTLTSWTTSISSGDILRFNVDSCTAIQRCSLVLTFTRA